MKQNLGYIGSKYSLLNFIHEIIKENIPDLQNKSFCDIFSGTNIVSIYFKDKVKKVISNDLEYYSYVLAKAYLNNNILYQYQINELNNLPPIKSKFYNFYAENGESNRLYFNEENGSKIEAIRIELEILKNTPEYYYLLTSLLEASDRVANTTSVYGAFLKKVKKSAQKNIELKTLNIKKVDNQVNDSYNEDANTLIKRIKGDILYIDPPYNHRQYGSNYHILNTIAKYDFTIKPKGVTGIMEYNKSDYCSKVKAKETFEDLISNAKFEHIFISYNNEGIIKKKEFEEILSKFGKLKIYEQPHKTYKADSQRNNKSKNTIEYLFYLKKTKIYNGL